MEMDLASSRSQIEQISNISRASETALEKVSEAFEEYKRTTEANLAENEVGSYTQSSNFSFSIFSSRRWDLSGISYLRKSLNLQLQTPNSTS